MKSAKTIALFILALLIIPAAFAMQEQKSEVPMPRIASCIIRITIDKKDSLPPEETLNYVRSILQSSGVSLQAAKDFMDFDDKTLNAVYSTKENIDELINVSLIGQQLVGKDVIYTFKLKISDSDMGGKNVNAPWFMKIIIEGLKREFDNSYQDYVKRIGQEVKVAEENAKNAEKEFYTLQEQMRKISGDSDLSRRKVLTDINNLQAKIEFQQLNISQFDAQLEDLPKRIESAKKRIDEKLKNDTILNELENMVKMAQKQLESVKQLHETGSISSQDLNIAQEKLARAQLDVTRRKEELQRPSGRDNIDSLNEQIASISSEKNRYMKLQETCHYQLIVAKRNLGISDEYEVLSIKSDIAKASLRKALENLADLKQNADIVAPTITVLGD